MSKTKNREKQASPAALKQLFAVDKRVVEANQRHDAMYGLACEKVAWRCAYQRASRRLDPESIWVHHRAIDADKQAVMNYPLETSNE